MTTVSSDKKDDAANTGREKLTQVRPQEKTREDKPGRLKVIIKREVKPK